MRHPALALLIVPLILAAATQRSSAWTGPMDSRVAREAVRLMPLSLRGVLESHLDDLNAGARQAADDESSPWHHQDHGQTAPCAAARVEELTASAVSMIDAHRPFADVAVQLGALSHFIGDLNNPLQVSSDDPREIQYFHDYMEYVESNIDKFPLVFYGWKEPSLDGPGAPGPRVFSERIATRARQYYVRLGQAYAANNPAPLAQRFDVRSLPFAIGSLSYSHSVTDTARIWLEIWERAHGDLRGTPYLARDRSSLPPSGVKVITGTAKVDKP
ncbi:MAG TPA: hypothetical protein VFE84_07895 [Patescibacteria group bacterium]|nr:hypothetical protein [Patescibacteria group bacterium]